MDSPQISNRLQRNYTLPIQMETFSPYIFSLFFLLPLLVSSTDTQVYIVYFGEHNGKKAMHEIEETHLLCLSSVKETKDEAKTSLLYSYKHVINGFAAVLTPSQASKLSRMEGVISVLPSRPRKHIMHTTRSWEFIGLDEELKPQVHMEKHKDLLTRANYGQNVIVGLLDSGFWPESKSFNDDGMEPIPKAWKGTCQTGQAFNSSHCNRKVIGARYYLKAYENDLGPLNTTLDYRSPRDKDGHGTHTASTVGGRVVPGASFMGSLAQGTASGGASLVRLAIYKVCWAIPGQEKADGNGCYHADILAAIDDAINDGVDVLSISIGATHPLGYYDDGIAIAALHAVKRNIVVACSAGNEGPNAGTLANTAPWLITVGASSMDRKFLAPLVLGNGLRIEGQTTSTYKLEDKMYSLVYAGDIALPNVTQDNAGKCLAQTLSPDKAKGKIVLCIGGRYSRLQSGLEVKRAGGIGFILGNSPINGQMVDSDPHVLPASAVGAKEALQILNYINSTNNPTATIIPATTVVNAAPAPFMAYFSSRGPNVIDPTILKPDITAPGLNILAAWTEEDSPSKLGGDERRVKWNIYSGTSMSCPHVAAASALLKAIHPTWSSAAIRSALITTAGIENNNGSIITDFEGNPADPFQFGSGHLRPTKAADPGLVYDASYSDYLTYLCSLRVKVPDPSFKCPKALPKTNDLNYPTIAIAKLNGTITITRTVTNVGKSRSTYFASITTPKGYNVNISPNVLIFNHRGQKKSFNITVVKEENMKGNKLGMYEFGWISWFDGIHTVRSPMVVSSV